MSLLERSRLFAWYSNLLLTYCCGLPG